QQVGGHPEPEVDEAVNQDRDHASREPPAEKRLLAELSSPVGLFEPPWPSTTFTAFRGPVARVLYRPRSNDVSFSRALPSHGRDDAQTKEQRERYAHHASLCRELEVVVVIVIPDPALDGRRLVGPERMEQRAETRREERVVDDDPQTLGCHRHTWAEPGVGFLDGSHAGVLVGGCPEEESTEAHQQKPTSNHRRRPALDEPQLPILP